MCGAWKLDGLERAYKETRNCEVMGCAKTRAAKMLRSI
ncbi:hypothetical protein CES85_1992 [Ochrobactrum quorumnocens]|uniref:Uncharacterized protein n=1 Tax=Ochrobactrum quorumnocens TaxID=271865 RepID=A0A248UG48_9HYPH|nr:hypothetical protein CES85_1992 [[Ochrobactrum] quorumnocens]